MKNPAILLLSLITLAGCPNVEELPERVDVRINVAGLEFQSNESDSLKSAMDDIFSDFQHIYSHTDISLDKEGAYYNLSTASIGQGIYTSLAVGTYHVYGWGGYASPFGAAEMSFFIPEGEVVIDAGSTSIQINAEPDCCLILVADFHDQLESAYISGSSNPGTGFFKMDHYYFSYLNPESNNQVHIVKKSGAEILMNPSELSKGYKYKVEITSE